MRVIIFGGFLGSGKTTIISKMLHGIIDSGQTAAVIENEVGETGIDDALVGEAGVSVTPLFGGCVCCQITGSLMLAVDKIRTEIAPDWLVVEMTGLAMLSGIRDTFEWYSQPGTLINTVSVADMSRLDKMVKSAMPLLERQLGGADIVLMNKTDVTQPTPESLALIEEISGGHAIAVCAKDLSNQEIWTLISGTLAERSCEQ